jgi:opacity protein-like surface antigen
MKNIIIPAMLFATCAANAAILPTYQPDTVRKQTKNGVLTSTPSKKSKPTKFYVSAKAGYNLSFASIYTNENTNSGFTFNGNGAVFSGALGVDFNRSPIRLELEISNTNVSDVKFADGWDSHFSADVGYTSFIANFIPYFKISDTVNFNLIVGLGGASLKFDFSDSDDTWDIKPSKGAFAFNAGIGLDIKLSDNFVILPEIKYTGLYTTTKASIYIPYYGYAESDSESFLLHNINFMAGIRYTF